MESVSPWEGFRCHFSGQAETKHRHCGVGDNIVPLVGFISTGKLSIPELGFWGGWAAVSESPSSRYNPEQSKISQEEKIE